MRELVCCLLRYGGNGQLLSSGQYISHLEVAPLWAIRFYCFPHLVFVCVKGSDCFKGMRGFWAWNHNRQPEKYSAVLSLRLLVWGSFRFLEKLPRLPLLFPFDSNVVIVVNLDFASADLLLSFMLVTGGCWPLSLPTQKILLAASLAADLRCFHRVTFCRLYVPLLVSWAYRWA